LRQLAHTLKSASGYIGAARLQLAAVRLLADKAPRELLAATLRQELQDALSAITALVPLPLPIAGAGPVVLAEDVAEILGELEHLIRAGDARASLQLAELEQGLAGTPLAGGLAAIREAFDDLDLAQALEQLAVCRETCAAAGEASL
jgi:HPt (histidine-containing phosphotransfer) domain-containing protein